MRRSSATWRPSRDAPAAGLFTDDGYIAGICNFAEPQGNHGLYATPRSIYNLLDRNNLMALYAPVSRGLGHAAGRRRHGGTARGGTPPVAVARAPVARPRGDRSGPRPRRQRRDHRPSTPAAWESPSRCRASREFLGPRRRTTTAHRLAAAAGSTAEPNRLESGPVGGS